MKENGDEEKPRLIILFTLYHCWADDAGAVVKGGVDGGEEGGRGSMASALQ